VASEYGSSEGPRRGSIEQLLQIFIARSHTIPNAEAKYQAWRITVDAREKD